MLDMNRPEAFKAMTSEQRLIEQITELPSLPAVAARSLRHPTAGSPSIEFLSGIIEDDSEFASRFLEIVNSAYYGLPSEVRSVRDAVVILGVEVSQSLAIAATVTTRLWVLDETFDAADFWRHSLARGLFAEIIANRVNLPGPHSAFVLGLLQDVGQIAMLQAIPDRCHEIELQAAELRIYRWRAEQQTLRFTHADVGARLAEKWNLCKEFCEAIRWHHQPEKSSVGTQHALVLQLADAMTNASYPALSREYVTTPLYRGLWEPLGLDEPAARAIYDTRYFVEERSHAFFENILWS